MYICTSYAYTSLLYMYTVQYVHMYLDVAQDIQSEPCLETRSSRRNATLDINGNVLLYVCMYVAIAIASY